MDLARELGAEDGFSTQRLCIYIPNKDQYDAVIPDHEQWVTEAREILSQIGGGTTALPPADGTWKKDNGEIIWEKTRLVFCFIDPDRFEDHIKNLKDFLHRFGRETNQGEVVVEFDGQFYRIKTYDSEGG